MAQGRLTTVQHKIAALEQARNHASGGELDSEAAARLEKLYAERTFLNAYKQERGTIGVFPAGTQWRQADVADRRKRSAVVIGTDLLFPVCAADKIAFPNIVARSSLFGIASKGLASGEQVIVATEGETVASVCGHLLSQADLDVWLQCTKLASDQPGQTVQLSPYEFLKNLGKSIGTTTYNSLFASLARLAQVYLTVARNRVVLFEGVLITYELEQLAASRMLTLVIHPDWPRLLTTGDWSAHRLSLRYRLAGKPIAQLLTLIANTHKPGFPFRVEALYTAARSDASRAEFTRLAKKALQQAIKVGIVKPDSKLAGEKFELGR